MNATLPDWHASRPWRNNNPGDLRTLGGGQVWDGQVGVDNLHGGPFAVFSDRVKGWRALGVNLLVYQDRHGINTLDAIVHRWAPSNDGNNERAYLTIMRAGYDATGQSYPGDAAIIDLHQIEDLEAVATGIAIAEGSARIQWPEDEKLAGLREALLSGA